MRGSQGEQLQGSTPRYLSIEYPRPRYSRSLSHSSGAEEDAPLMQNGPRGGFRSGSTRDEAQHNDDVMPTQRPLFY